MPRRSRWPAAIASLAAAAASLASLASPASALDPVDDARARLEQAQSEAAAAADRYEGTVAERDQTEQEIGRLEQEIVSVENEIVSVENQMSLLRAQRAELRRLVEARAAELYKAGNPSDWLGAMDDAATTARQVKLGQSALEADVAHAELLAATTAQLEQTRADLDVQRTDLSRRRTELDQRRAELDDLVASLEAQRAEFERKVAAANAALEKAKALGALLASGTPVMGDAVLTAADIAGWFRTTDSRARLADGLTIDGLAAIFIE